MAQKTQRYKQSMSGSIGAGMKSLFGGSGRRYVVIEHKVSSKYHKAGEEQQIIVDNVEIGRDPNCAIRLEGRSEDDSMFAIVSRKHAAIQRDGDNWKLIHLSKTNSTILNGTRMTAMGQEWYLQNGDEIQIAENGPKLGFKIPAGDKGLVKSIGLTARMSLFRQQALRPYKQAITALACLLLLCIAGGVWKIMSLDSELSKKTQQIASLIDANSRNRDMTDSLINELIATNQQMGDYEQKIADMARETADARRQARQAQAQAAAAIEAAEHQSGDAAPGALKEQCFPHTYAIYELKSEIRYPNGEVETEDGGNLVGTGFLLSNGRFVTARHVVETYYYFNANWGDDRISNALLLQNLVANNGGEIVTTFLAISNSGDRIQFTNKQCTIDRSGDRAATTTLENGMTAALKVASNDAADWAAFSTSKSGLPFDAEMSAHLPIGTNLQILGFPYGRGGENPSAVSPISSHAEVARDGLDVNGTIMTSNDDTQSGNSGGPVFMIKDGKYIVIGILSGSTLAKGRVVPIKVVR